MLRSYWWVFLCAAGIGWVVGNLAAGFVSFQMPKLFESRAVIEVKPPTIPDSSQPDASRASTSAEILRILREDSMPDVAERLKHDRKVQFPPTVTLESLRKAVVCESLEKPGLISIKVRLKGKFDARDTVAELLDSLVWWVNSPTKEERFQRKSLEDELEDLKKRKFELSVRLNRHHGSPYRSTAETASAANDGFLLGQTIRKDLETTEKRIPNLIEKLDRFDEESRSRKKTIKIVSAPQISDRPISPDIDFNLMVGKVAGVGLFETICLLVLSHRRRYRSLS